MRLLNGAPRTLRNCGMHFVKIELEGLRVCIHSLSLPLFVVRSSARVAQERRVTAAERNKKLGR